MKTRHLRKRKTMNRSKFPVVKVHTVDEPDVIDLVSINRSEKPIVLSDSESEFQGFKVHTVDESDVEVITLDDSNVNQPKACFTVDETADFIPIEMNVLPKIRTRGRKRYFDASPDVIVLKKPKRSPVDVIAFSKTDVEKCDRPKRKKTSKVACKFKEIKDQVSTRLAPKVNRLFKNYRNRKIPRIQLTHTNVYNTSVTPVQAGGLRPVIIDGCNVAFAFGNRKFEIEGIIFVVELFKERGHKEIVCFLPQFYQGKTRPKDIDKQIKRYERENIITYTPSRKLNGKSITPYDDRFIVQYASEREGVIISNDGYQDLINEEASWRTTIEKRIINFTFARGLFMLPKDPLGPNGPTLDEMLRFPLT